ncbi:MAG: tandem-95 repeat protein, partial [Verrucomicrobia bacterium]|nr:tandem-95 repeat protein [Verrucomicrobiota bacterium]
RGVGSLDPASDQDWWVFEAEAGDRVGVAMDSAQVDGYIHLYDESGRELWGENNGGPGNSDYYSHWRAPEAGKYYVRVRSYGGVGTYEVRVELARGMDLESDGDYANDTMDGADGLVLEQEGNVQRGRVAGTVMNRQGGNFDEDRYVLGVLNAGNTVELVVELPGTSTLVPWVRVLNSAGQEVLDEDPSGERFYGTILASDTYYAEVSNRYWVWQGRGYGYSAWGTWAVAEAAAVGMGGHLVAIGSAAEQGFVYGRFCSGVTDMWVGLTDEGEEGVWVWVSGEEVGYTNWAGGEPNSGDSYDYAYMHEGNGLWYDGHYTHERWGLAEWEDSAGREYAGTGPWGQYAMGVAIGDGVAPAVVEVRRLPGEGGRTNNVLATFSVMFSEALAPGTVNGVESWDLREAGMDGEFGSGDDVVYAVVVSPEYGTGTVVSVLVTDGPLGTGKYRMTIRESVTDVVGNWLDGDGDGEAGGDYVLNFEVALAAGYVFEGRSNETQGTATELGLAEGLSGLWLGRGVGSLDPASDQDWWVFEAEAGDRVGVAMDSGQVDGYIHLYDESGRELWGENNGGPGSSDYYSYWTAPEAGKYYVRVRSYGGVGTYEVRVELVRGIDLESDGDYANDSIGGADAVTLIADGSRWMGTVAGTVMAGQSGNVDEDYFKLGTIEAGKTILLSTRLPADSTLRPLVEIRNANNQVVSIATNPSEAVARADVSVAGEYYAVVVASSGEGPRGQYVLDVAVLPTAELSFADLVVVDADVVVPATASSGQTIRVTWTTGNFGAVPTPVGEDVWIDRVVLSVNDRYGDADDIELGQLTHTGALGVGEKYAVAAALDVMLPKGMSGGYYILIKTDITNRVREFIFEENNVGAPRPIEIALTPAADLEVGPVTTSSGQYAAGGPATIDWSVTNQGAGVTGDGTPGGEVALWVDWIVFSPNAVFGDGDDVLIQEVTHTGLLTAGGGYTGAWSGLLPAGLNGVFHVFVMVDRTDLVYEGEDASANVVERAGTVMVSAQPFVDLVVSGVVAPTSGASGMVVEIEWQVTNQGSDPTADMTWSDAVYLSSDEQFGGDTLLGTFARSGVLGVGGSYPQQQTVTLPAGLAAGTYYIFVLTDALGQVVEPGAEGNNSGRATAALIVAESPAPDLVVVVVNGPLTGRIGGAASVSWTVRNAGDAAAAGGWTDRVYLSESGQAGDGVLLGSFVRSEGLAVGGEYTRNETVTLPVLADGAYYLVVVTDALGQVFERQGEENNSSATVEPLSLGHPDLVVDTVNGPPTGQSGSAVTVEWTVRNAGTAETGATWVDVVYLSEDTVWSANDTVLGQRVRTGALAAGGIYEAVLNVVLPDGLAGTYHLVVRTDAAGQVEEGSGEANNSRSAVPMTVALAPYADLEISGVTAQALVVGDPVDLTVSWTVTNRGTGAGTVDSWNDQVILSIDDVLGNGDDRVVGEFTHTGLMPAGSFYTVTHIVQLPAATEGRFQLFVRADAGDAVYEHTDEAPNVGRPDHPVDVVRRVYADLVVNAVNVPAGAVAQNGKAITLEWTVTNDPANGIGPTDTAQWDDRVYMSADPTGAGWRMIGSFSHAGPLGLGDSYSRSAEVVLPADASGTIYLFVRTGGPFEFIYTENNTARSEAVEVQYVPPPRSDLEVTVVTGPAEAVDGESVEITWTVVNRGPDTVEGSWTDTIYLAPNGDMAQAVTLRSFARSLAVEPGKSYTRTELVELPAHRQGLFKVFVRTDAGDTVLETNDENNLLGATGALTLALRPRPDLQVTTVVAPTIVTSGGVIDVEFTVTNLGPVSTPTGGSRWTDAVYLSFNREPGGILLGQLPNGSALETGGAYHTRATFRIPIAAAGEFFVVVQADSGLQVDEYPQESNNYNSPAAPLVVDVTPVPRPDLVVQQVAVPVEAFDGNSIVVRYRVANLGAGVTFPGSWSDSIWLTRAPDRPNAFRGDVFLGKVGHAGALEVGGFYENTVSVNLPSHIQGQFYITVWADAYDAVFENAFDVNLNPDAPNDMEGSNFKATPIAVLYSPPSDLEVTDLIVPQVAWGGQEVTITWTVTNHGSNRTDRDRWADLIYISTDDSLDTNLGEPQLVFGVPHFGTLERGQSYTETVTLPLPPSAQGSYFIVKTNADPNYLLTEEESFLAQVKGIMERAEQKLGKPLSQVSVGDLDKLTKGDIMQILTGDGTMGFVPVWEGPFTDNNERAAPSAIANRSPDLVVSGVVGPATAFSGEPIEITYTVTNQGAGAVWGGTRRWRDFVYVSLDETFSPSRAYLAAAVTHEATTALEPGQSYSETARLTLPEGISGKRYVHVFTAIAIDRDGNPVFDEPSPGQYPDWPKHFREIVWETPDRRNNRGAPALVQVIYREADLQVTDMAVATTGSSGGFISLEFTVRNALREDSRTTRVDAWLDRVFISSDTSLDGYDELIGDFRHLGALEPGGSYRVQGEVRLPDNIGGQYYLLIYVDSPFGRNPMAQVQPFPIQQGPDRVVQNSPMGTVHEFARENDNLAVRPIQVAQVTPPDLRVTGVTAPAHVLTGREFAVTYTVVNVADAGPVPERQGTWHDYVFLSRDPYLDVRSDHFLGELKHVGALEPGADYSRTASYGVPRGLVGPYYVIVLTDRPGAFEPRGAVIEGNEGNNATAVTVPMLIELPPPSDLQVDQVNVPEAVYTGDSVTLTWRVSNHGAEPAGGVWADSVYLSLDGVWDLGDKLIGTLEYRPRTLAQGEGYTATLTARLPVTLPGTYRVIVRCDIFDDIYEGPDNRNNALPSVEAMTVRVKTLTLGVVAKDKLSTGAELLYRVEVGAGETLRVDLKSPAGGANELYLRHEALPDSIRFDAAYAGYLTANQTAVIPSTEPGVYYIRVRSTSAPQADTPVTLVARRVPFGIINVTPDTGGAGRYVTMTITGAKFSPGATVKLIRPMFAEFAPANYAVIDATRIVATFDLRNAPRGLYDLQVTNPDGAVSRVPYRYLIESPMPIDVTVGMGGPTLLPITRTGVSPGIYGVSLLGLTNVDMPYVHLEFGVPRLPNPVAALIPGERLIFTTNFMGAPGLNGVAWSAVDPVLNLGGDLIASGFAFDLVNQGFGALTFIVEPYPGLKELLREDPDFLKELQGFELSDLAFEFYIQAAATPMTAQEYVDYQRANARAVRDRILADAEAPTALKLAAADEGIWTDLYLVALADTGLLRPEDQAPEIRTQTKFVGAVASLVAGLLGGEPGQPVLREDDLSGFFELVRKWMGHDPEAYGSSALPEPSRFDLGMSHPTHFEAFRIKVGVDDLVEAEQLIAPVPDVNLSDYFGIIGERSNRVSLTGPAGVGFDNLIPLGTPLPYVIRILNPSEATRSVTELRIVQQIDASLDVRGFQLSDLLLGDLVIDLPDGRGAFTGEFDFSESRGYILQVTAGVDVNARVATWLLRAVDPDTGLLVTDPKIGLLSPGSVATAGFSVKALPEAADGARVTATARVIVDGGVPLDSNTVAATIDAVAPVTTLMVQTLGNGTYALQWTARDNPLGAGVKDSTVYVSLNGAPFSPFRTKTTETALWFESPGGLPATFLVLSSDAAGNVEAAPAGVVVPPYQPSVNLGALPTAPVREPVALTMAPPVTLPATNPLFLGALLQVPGVQSGARPSGFARVFEPFTAAAFATGIDPSGAGIGPLGIAFDPGGESVLISGGAGRNQLWIFSLAGGTAATPLAVLDVPIYDLTFDADGLLWATTGGGPLVQLDPATGQILERYGEGINLGLAAATNSTKLYVSTGRGVEIFDTATRAFAPFSSTRVDGLALSPEGELWGTTWPHDGQIVRFDRRGRAEIVLELDEPAEGLAFGRAGTPTANLLFVSHETGGKLTLVDLVSLKTVQLATGGSRGDFVHIDQAGRVFVTQSDRVTVLFPVTVPQVIATTPVTGGGVLPVVNRATVTFDLDMLHGGAADPASVTNPANYELTNLGTGQRFSVGDANYDRSSRTVRLSFESLTPARYELRVAGGLESELGIALGQDYAVEFQVLQDLTANLVTQFGETRLNRADGTVSFDVRVTNSLSFAVVAPVRVVFGGLVAGTPGVGAGVVGADGVTAEGHPYVDLALGADNLMAPGETLVRTVTVADPDAFGLELQPRVLAGVAVNLPPVFNSTPQAAAAVGQAYRYAPEAGDPDGGSLAYVLVRGPAGLAVDPVTGLIDWTPAATDGRTVDFELRVYDNRGAFAPQVWTVAVQGGNTAPVMFPIDHLVIREGDLLELPVGGFDADGDRLTFGANRLPPGAVFDGEDNVIRWQTNGDSAGRYSGIEVFVTDGDELTSVQFEILVLNVNQAPVLDAIPNRTVREGETLQFSLTARDVDGDALVFSAPILPPGATLVPESGLFTWTPRYDQHGLTEIEFIVTDGQLTARRKVAIDVLNVNGQVTLTGLDRFVIFEGQALKLRVVAADPDHPGASSTPLVVGPDLQIEEGAIASSVTYEHSALPTGAVYDPTTHLLTWTPGYRQAGTYSITFTASDDGDGTGVATTATATMVIEVRDANAPPVIEPVANQTVDAGQVLEFTIAATDADGTIPSLMAKGLPSFASFRDNGDGTATVRATPGYADRGNSAVTVYATDDGNGNPAAVITTGVSFVLTARLENAQPVLRWVGDTVALIDQELVIRIVAADLDEEPLTFSGTDLPTGATLTPTGIYGVAEFRWRPAAADAGTRTVTFEVRDQGNGNPDHVRSDTVTFRLVVRTANQAPTLVPVEPRTLAEGQTLTLVLAGTDPDGDALTYTATDLPLGATFDPETGTLRWTPDSTQAGHYTVRLGVTDGNLEDVETVALTVTNVNTAPRFIPLPGLLTQEGITISFSLAAGDLDGDLVRVAVVGQLPAGAEFDAATGLLVWTPGFDQAGEHLLRFEAEDPGGLKAYTDVVVQVVEANRPPAIPILGGRVALVGQSFRFFVPGADPDAGTTLTYTAAGLPQGAVFNAATGELTWTPTSVQVGEHAVRFTVSDGELTASRTMRLVVAHEPIPPDVRIEITPSFPLPAGQSALIQVVASGIAPIASVTLEINGTPQTLDRFGRVSFTPTAPGHYSIQAVATDTGGVTGSAVADLKVRDLTDRLAPTLTLALPPAGAVLMVDTEIVGSVQDTNLDEFVVELTPIGRSGTTVLARGQAAVEGVLGHIDPDRWANGAYLLTLRATDLGGRTTVLTRLIEVNTATKSGSFATTATDLTTTLAGVPIALVRHYRSVDAVVAGTLGWGWQLAGVDSQLTTNSIPTGDEDLGRFNAFESGTRAYVNLPDGRRVGFTFAPLPVTVGTTTLYRPAWVGDAGVDYRLASADATLEVADGAYYQVGTGLPYHPASGHFGGFAYSLTGPDGTRYDYAADGRLRQLTGANGQQLIWSDSGAIATSGERITFQHDADGRLISASAPGGRPVFYEYDTVGRLQTVTNLGTGRRTVFGYGADANAPLTILLAPAGENSLAVRYDALGAWVGTDTLTGVLGSLRPLLGASTNNLLAAGETDRFAFLLGSRELATANSGTVTLAIEIRGLNGFNPAAPVVAGLSTGDARLEPGRSIAFFTLSAAGAYLLEVRGADAQAAGDYTVEVYLPGDVNGDAQVDGTDSAAFAAARGSTVGQPDYLLGADANRDGIVDGEDEPFLDANFSFVANREPSVQGTTVTTLRELPVTIDLSLLAQDIDGDTLRFIVSNVIHGQVRFTGDGRSAIFTPEAGYTGAAGFEIRVDDGSVISDTATVSVTITDTALAYLRMTPRDPVLAAGQTVTLSVWGELTDARRIELPSGYVEFQSSDPAVAIVSGKGVVLGLAPGVTIVTASTRDGRVAATPVSVGTAATRLLEFYPSAYVLAAGGQTRQFVVRERVGDHVFDLSSSAAGTRYFVGNPAIGSISADGLFTSALAGDTEVTVIQGGRSSVVPLRVTVPVVGQAEVGTQGGLIADGSGIVVGIPAGALTGTTIVTVTPQQESDLPYALPEGTTFGGGFLLDFGGTELEVAPSVTMPAPAGTIPGQFVFIFHPVEVVLEPGGPVERTWLLVDRMVVGEDGQMRTTSPPFVGGFPNGGGPLWKVDARAFC